MRPGGWNVTPLLSSDESLEERLLADARRLRDAGVSGAELGVTLAALLENAQGSDWSMPVTHGELQVELRRRRGVMTCPWAPEEFAGCGKGDGGKRGGANQFLIRNSETGATLEGIALSAHLIAEHDFFGGTGTPFRIEPEDLIALLGRPSSSGLQ